MHLPPWQAGIRNSVSTLMSIDSDGMYKPSLEVYQIPEKTLGIRKEEILFVATHAWDITGAKLYGYKTCWINWKNEPFGELGVRPDYIIKNIRELITILK